jgi:hypothetical protein
MDWKVVQHGAREQVRESAAGQPVTSVQIALRHLSLFVSCGALGKATPWKLLVDGALAGVVRIARLSQ